MRSGRGGPIAVLAGFWFAIATVVSPGTTSPLTYVPLFNPLELTLALTLVALFLWSSRFSRLRDTTRFAWLGVGLFGLLNGAALRTAHHSGRDSVAAVGAAGLQIVAGGIDAAHGPRRPSY